jgi:PAS domain S-box-containing protein
VSTSARRVRAREIRLKTLAILVTVALVVTATALWQQYQTAISRTGLQLQELARAQAWLIESVAKYDAVHAGPEGWSRQATLSEIREAHYRNHGFGRTGEIVLAETRDSMIHFLLPQPSLAFKIPDPVPLGGARSSMITDALRGHSGLDEGPDAQGHKVLEAYEWLPFLGVGLGVKMDVAEIRAPILRNALITLLIGVIVVAIGILLHERVVGPLLAQVFRSNVELESGLRTAGNLSERYATVFRSAVDPILIQDLRGTIAETNHAAAAALGWSAEELVGKPFAMLSSPDRGMALEVLMARCARGEDVRDVESVWITQSGEALNVLLTFSLLKDADGRPAAISTMAKDITELVQARLRLEEHSKGLEAQVQERTVALEHELRVARALAEEARRGHELALVGDSIQARAMREQIERHAKTADPLLLGGPAGSGQESVARAIHERSDRAAHPFIVVDCSRPLGADTTPLLGITRDANRGKMSIADGGTLYLDLVAFLPADIQEALATFLVESTAARARGEKPEPDVRFISYLPSDPHAAVATGELHAGLADVLSRNRLVVSSLGERRDDIPAIALRMMQNRARALGKPAVGFTPRAVRAMQDYSWPGNIRELQNVIERAVLVSIGSEIDIEDDLRSQTRSVGGYRLVRQLGRGGMGEVWLAEHALLKRPAAVKLTQLRSDSSAEERASVERRFRREAEVTSRLRSPHTVELYDFGVTEEGLFYYVMEFMEGFDFHAIVNKHGIMAPERAAYLVRQACLSLGEAHDAGLIHRDIKPENMFVCRMGHDLDFVKVLDFGIVKQTASQGTSNTETGMVIGTPAYMAPEVGSGGPPTPQSDLYALGCVLYSLVTGRMVFDVDTPMGIIIAHVEQQPVPPSQVAGQPIPDALERLILQCLEKDPKLRPQSAEALRTALGEIDFEDPWTETRASSWWSAISRESSPTAMLKLSRESLSKL